VILTQDGMTMEEIEKIYTKSDINGFPIVNSKESQILLGYIFKRDLKMAFGR
jgi:chloride channel 3/4/5